MMKEVDARLRKKVAFSLVAVVLSFLFFYSLCTGAVQMARFLRIPRSIVLYYGIFVAFSSMFICWCLTGRKIHLAGLVIPLLVILPPLFIPWDGRGSLHEIYPHRSWLLLIYGIITNVLIAFTWILVVHFSNRASLRSQLARPMEKETTDCTD